MKDEIKEHMQNCVDREESCLLNSDNTKLLLDYITNLQEKVNQYENPDDLTLFYMWLDVKAKDKMKQLQEENERLKELCDKYEEEHNTTFQKWLKELKGGEK